MTYLRLIKSKEENDAHQTYVRSQFCLVGFEDAIFRTDYLVDDIYACLLDDRLEDARQLSKELVKSQRLIRKILKDYIDTRQDFHEQLLMVSGV